ncbi:hypothetical protein [Pseudomonas synxantha]|uniref:hypothetical protein n=1 Tax=Pseudomonas synxantha TaxID=47883 RepID=UPI001F14DDCF|nr:hypothetical protein [Pseudomonas synxantha]
MTFSTKLLDAAFNPIVLCNPVDTKPARLPSSLFAVGVKLIKSSVISCLALLTGCVGHYQQPAPDAAHATLEAKWGSNNLVSGGSQAFYAFYDNNCNDTEETGVLGGISASNPEINRFLIKPERRIYLNALSTGVKIRKTTDESLIHKSCLTIRSFIPHTGATYRITLSTPDSGCSLEVIDVQTGKVPDTLMVEPVSKECGLN